MNADITVFNQNIEIAGFSCESFGEINTATIDLTPYAGQYVRVWLDNDGSYSLDPSTSHFWQMAEFTVPKMQYQDVDTGEKDEQGNPVMQPRTLPLNLENMEIIVLELPK